MRVLYGIIITVFSAYAFAGCGVEKAKITMIHQYFNGEVFVDFNKKTTCDCSIPGRLAFLSSDENIDFIKSMVLMAFASDRVVSAHSNIAGCPIHGNTAKMNYFRVWPEGTSE